MSEGAIEHTLARTRAQLDALRAPLEAGDTTAAEEALEALSIALEELDVTLEELHQQNLELIATRAQLVQERSHFADLFRRAPEPYLVTDTEGVILEANSAAAALLHAQVGRLPGRVLPLFVAPDDRPAFRELLRSLPASPAAFELTILPKDHAAVVVSASVVAHQPRRDVTELRWVLRDVTDSRRAQVALQAAFARSNEETQELRDRDRWKDAFLAATAHDLRAPLAIISSSSETLLQRFDLGDGRHLVEIIGAQSLRLRQLLDDLLDLDRFTRGTVTAERAPTDLAELVASVLRDLPVDAHQVDVDVPSLVAHVDGARTGQILSNLVRNATTHTPPGTSITIRVRRVDDGVELVVADDGPGIPAALREEVFHPFVTRPAHDGDGVGTGIGLSLVQLFAELHTGSARVEEADTGGAQFVVHLPARVDG